MSNLINPCLVTQVEQDSPNLERGVGEIKLVVLLPANQRVVLWVNRQRGYESTFRSITDGVKFSNSATGELTDTLIMASNETSKDVYVSNSANEERKAVIFISNKYYFSNIAWNTAAANAGARIYTESYKEESSEWLNGIVNLVGLVGKVQDLTGMYNVTALSIETNTPSTTDDWGVFINLTNYNFDYNVSGDIVKLGKCTALTNLAFGKSHCYGTIESLIQAFRANGRTTGSMTGNSANYSDVTFNGRTENAKGTVSWTPTTITMNGITIEA